MLELTANEIDMVSGADGFFESIGNAFDNPWTTLGKAMDAGVKIVSKVATGEIKAPPTPVFASH